MRLQSHMICNHSTYHQTTVRVHPSTTIDSELVVISPDFDEHTSVYGQSVALNTVPHEVCELVKIKSSYIDGCS